MNSVLISRKQIALLTFLAVIKMQRQLLIKHIFFSLLNEEISTTFSKILKVMRSYGTDSYDLRGVLIVSFNSIVRRRISIFQFSHAVILVHKVHLSGNFATDNVAPPTLLPVRKSVHLLSSEQ